MAHAHSHDADEPSIVTPPRVRLILAAVLAPLLLGVVVGLVVLWPQSLSDRLPSTEQGVPQQERELYDAVVDSVKLLPCGGAEQCQAVVVRVSEGPDEGSFQPLPSIALGADAPRFSVGDEIVVERSVIPQEDWVAYNFTDIQRSTSLLVLAALFAIVVIGVARLRGLAALAGLVVTYAVLVRFLIPALLDGKNAMAVALVSGGLIMFVVLYLAHGVNGRTTAALIGTLISLVLTGVLAQIFITATQLTGLTSDEATYVKTQLGGSINLRGVLLAGTIIGALGALNDVTVTQASAIWEIHAANPERGFRRLYGSGMRVGRDHIASTVDTLVLAYAGASLPLFIVFAIGSVSLGRILTGSIVAEEIVRTLVGSIGLVASVPLTTALAALVVTRSPGPSPRSEADPDDEPETAVETSAPSDDATPDPDLDVHVDSAADATTDATSDAQRRAPTVAKTRRRATAPSEPRAWRPPKGERDLWDTDD